MENNKELKILIIEDDAVHRTVLENVLEEEGYSIITANDGEEGVELAFEHLPDLVLTDIRMPIKDGYSVCEDLRDNPKTKFIPVVMVSALIDTTDLVKGFDAGAFDYINKPFENNELMARVNAAIKYKELRDELSLVKQKTALLELAGAAAHELNQPLTILKTTAYLFRDRNKKGSLSDEDFERYLEKFDKSIERMSKTIGKMNSIDEYKTKDYAMGQKIINLSDSVEEE